MKKFVNKMKNFWRLQKKNNSGFTLVELIVVIAVLAILAGIAVPAYSGYVEKANKQADMTLASEIVQAIELRNLTTQFASDQNGIVGYVTVTVNGASATEGEIETAMVDVFGEGYESVLKLKYDGWTDTVTMLNLVKNNPYADSVNDSTYITNVGTEKLLGDVQNCATSFGSFLSKLHSGDKSAATNSMINGFADQDTIKSMLADAGYESNSDYANVSEATIQNITVLGVAAAVNKNPSEVVSGFSTGAVLGQQITPSQKLDEIANWYAAAEALVAYLDDPECSAAFYPGIDDEGNATGIDMSSGDALIIANNMNGVYEHIQQIIASDNTGKLAEKVTAYYTPNGIGGKSQAQLDGEAYVGIMSSVSELDNEYIKDKDAMNNANLFNGGTLDNRVNSYVTAAALAEKISDIALQTIINENSSGLVVVAIVNNGILKCEILPSEVLG